MAGTMDVWGSVDSLQCLSMTSRNVAAPFCHEPIPYQGPVWQQLEALCDSSPQCAPTHALEARQQAEAQLLRGTILELQQQLESSNARVQQLQQQLESSNARVQQQEQQLAAGHTKN